MNWRLVIVLALFFSALGFLGVVCWQIYEVPQRNPSLFSLEAIWPAKATWWAKTGLWVCIGLFAVLFHRWKRKD